MTSNRIHVLVPTDFSDNAASALRYALKLYASQQCTFYLLHTTYIDEAVDRAFNAAYTDENQNRTFEKKLIELISQTEAVNANANHQFEWLLSDKELRNAVKKAVKDQDIDMVVMGTKGATDAVEYVMGSNTIKVLRKISECPVMILPEGYSFIEPHQITFPTDYNRNYDEKELRPIKDLADLFQSKIRIVHINVDKNLSEVQEKNMAELKMYLANYEHSFHWLSDTSSKSKSIATFIDALEIDLLAMINYKHGVLERILNEPVIKKLAFHPTVPILVIPK